MMKQARDDTAPCFVEVHGSHSLSEYKAIAHHQWSTDWV